MQKRSKVVFKVKILGIFYFECEQFTFKEALFLLLTVALTAAILLQVCRHG